MKKSLQQLRQHLLTGVSHVIPCIACGGILIAIALAFAPMTEGKGPPEQSQILSLILQIGDAAFKLSFPILAGYIAYAIAGKPGLVPGMIGGFLSAGFPARLLFSAAHLEANGLPQDQMIVAGFLGAMIIGLIAGVGGARSKKVAHSEVLKPVMPILIIPIISSLFVGLLMIGVIGWPTGEVMARLGGWLRNQQTGDAVGLAMVLGAMIAFDMGGPVNKAAFFFGVAMIKEGEYGVMGACGAAICTPPLGLGLATVIQKSLWRQEDRDAGVAALAMGMIGITEGAIPFAASDPVRVIPCIILGSMTASTTAMLSHVGNHAPHGGPIVLPVIDNPMAYIAAIAIGTVVTAVSINAVKMLTQKREPQVAEMVA
ncbi:MAG: PTS fructose transporter subunit IIC [Planctomycetes bacterium]|nr:PTS fructose transporter subunit IIC [Planctomycetota bacterium]